MSDSTHKETRIIIAGFGGQGIVLAGNLIAHACVEEGKNFAMMVAYGAEMRGGTANSTVIISEGTIYSPVVTRADVAVILNTPSLDRYESIIVPGGLCVINESMIHREVRRDDISVAPVRATEIAHQLGNVRVANSVILGAMVGRTGLLTLTSLERAVESMMSQKKAALVALNLQALRAGYAQCAR